MKEQASDNHNYQQLPTDFSSSAIVPDATATPPKLLIRLQWRWVLIAAIPLTWASIFFVITRFIWPHLIKRDGNNLVYWTPHKTGSTSMRRWLSSVASTLEIDIGIARKYPNKPFEDHHRRFNRLHLNKCSFVAGHIRVPSVRVRENELKLGAVITTIREPFALLMSKYFHRTRRQLSPKSLENFKDPTSQTSRLWFFYWNDNDPCEQLRYYDGETGCETNDWEKGIRKRVQGIAERIDCVVDTDDPTHDLEALCRQMQLGDSECPQMPVLNVGGNSLYDQLLAIEHVKTVMMRTANVTIELRNAFMKRRCRFLDDGSLDTPGAEPPQWPFKGCNKVESTLDEDVEDDAPENDTHDDKEAGTEDGTSDETGGDGS